MSRVLIQRVYTRHAATFRKRVTVVSHVINQGRVMVRFSPFSFPHCSQYIIALLRFPVAEKRLTGDIMKHVAAKESAVSLWSKQDQ